MRMACVTISLLLWACHPNTRDESAATPVAAHTKVQAAAQSAETVRWTDARRALEALVCITQRTRWLRARLGPRVASDPQARAAVCDTIERFQFDTGIVIADCRETL